MDQPFDPHISRAYTAKIDDVKPGERSVVAVINTNAVDRFKTVIDPFGVKTANFDKSRLVLWEHGKDPRRGKLPVARCAWLKVDRGTKSIIAKSIFRQDEFADQLFSMYQDETLRGFSIDGLADPKTCGPPTIEEIKKRPELAECKCIYRTLELVEYSAVGIGGNPDALALAVSRGLWLPDERKAVLPPLTPKTPVLPPLRGRTLEDVTEAAVRRAMNAAGPMIREALQDARDLARGDI
ncbi:hypothetical protein [Singulisphaera sp. PoT]|uniref:hypothetical protein n=1 Tax=Singulisphaera sp. PoT TaxID=3411797 RepID=UPI003BF4A699